MTKETIIKNLRILHLLTEDQDMKETIRAAIKALKEIQENPFELVYNFLINLIIPCDEDLVNDARDYYLGVNEVINQIKLKADEYKQENANNENENN